jgi:hypothetical protein
MPKGARTTMWALGAVIALGAIACSGDEPNPTPTVSPAPSSASPTPTVSPTESIAGPICSNGLQVAEGLVTRLQGQLEGDVDGDGTDDIVWLARDDDGPAGCKTFVVAETAGGNLVAPTDPEGTMVGFEPRLQALVQADGRPGAEIIAQVLAGASTQFTAMFTVGDGGLVRVAVEPVGTFGAVADLFPFGGSVGHLEASDCAADGRIVVSVATPAGGSGERYEVERVFLRFEGSDLVQDQVTKRVVSAFKIQELPEYRSSPFGSCPTS